MDLILERYLTDFTLDPISSDVGYMLALKVICQVAWTDK